MDPIIYTHDCVVFCLAGVGSAPKDSCYSCTHIRRMCIVELVHDYVGEVPWITFVNQIIFYKFNITADQLSTFSRPNAKQYEWYKIPFDD